MAGKVPLSGIPWIITKSSFRASQVSRVATSKDGLHWTCVSENPVNWNMDAGDKESCKMWHKRTDIYVHTYILCCSAGSLSVHQGSCRPCVHWWGDSLVDARHLHVEQGWPSSLHCKGDDGGKLSSIAHSDIKPSFFSLLDLMPEQGTVGLGRTTGFKSLPLLQGLQTLWTDDQGQQVLEFKTPFWQKFLTLWSRPTSIGLLNFFIIINISNYYQGQQVK